MKNLFLIGFAALGLLAMSCSDDDKVVDQGGDGMNGYLTLALKSPTMTRAGADSQGKEAGTGKEVKINDVTVVLTKADGEIIQIVPTTMESASSTKKFSVDPGTHKVYALLNLGDPNATLSIGSNIEYVLSARFLTEVASGYKDGSFFMTNSRHSGQASAGIDVSIAAGEEKVLSVTVDRISAKIVDDTTTPVVTFSTDVTAVVNEVEVIGFVPLNVNADFNRIQIWGKDNTGGTDTQLSEDVLMTPAIKNLAPVTLYKEKVTNSDGSEAWKNTSTQKMFVDSVYTTENRPPILVNGQGVFTAKRNNTTGVIYSVQAKLNGVLCSTFYTYNGKAYATLTSLSAIFGSDLSGKSAPELRGLGINVYEDGIMYYTYFVKDPNKNNRLSGKDYFGVFRNSVYRLKINTINNLGDDVPDDNKEPEETIDPDNAYLKVELIVNDWALNNIAIDF